MKRIAIAGVLGFAVCGLAIAQVHRGGILGHSAQHHGDATSVVEHLSEFFPQIASFDANKDGILDETEKEALVT